MQENSEIVVTRIFQVNQKPLIAFVDVCLYNTILIKGIKVVETKKEKKIFMPAFRTKKSGWMATIQFIDFENKNMIYETILKSLNF